MGGLGHLFDRTIAAMLPVVPRPIVRRVASRYVAGETLDDALETVRRLMASGACATLDVLGEEIHDVSQGEEAERAYLDALERIARDRLDTNVSVKLTAFGLRQDPEVTYRRVRRVVARAAELGNFVRIDMEDSSTTTATLDLYRRLRGEGLDNTGVVLQAYMRRSMDDVESLAPLKTSYRLCKGIYVEPEELAFKKRDEINRNFEALLERMLELGSYVGIATHDHALAAFAEDLVRRKGLPREAFEFQMLLGVDEPLGRRLIAAGHRLRIYVPYGRDWYAYSMRRLKENPRIGRHVLFALFRP